MKSIFTLISVLAISLNVFAQEIPNATLLDENSNDFSSEYFNESHDKPIIVALWATWCIPCINELSAINDNLVDWKDEVDFEIYAVSIDDSRNAKKALALANGKGWEFDQVLLDINQDLKRGLNIANIPYLIVVKNGKIVHEKNNYTPGSEEELFEILKENAGSDEVIEVYEHTTTEAVMDAYVETPEDTVHEVEEAVSETKKEKRQRRKNRK